MKIIKTKLFKLLICIFLVGFFLGILSFIFTKSSEKIIIKENITLMINNIDSNNINYSSTIFNLSSSNLKIIFIIFICGLLCLPSIFIPILILYYSIKLSFDLISIIYAYKIKGLFLAIFYLIPKSIIFFILILMSYYSIYQAIKCFKVIKQNKQVNLKDFFKNYILIYIILSFIIVILSIISVYFILFITKIVV